jgi:hypothetical protein
MTCAPSHTAKRQADRRGDARRDGGDPAVERADTGSESVVNQVARKWLPAFGQRAVKDPARDTIGDLHGGILVRLLVGGWLLLPSTGADSGEALVDDTHRAGRDHAADETSDHAAPNPHAIGWVGRPVSLSDAAPLREP